MKTKVAVLGSGNFGIVLADILASNGNEVALWGRNHELLQTIAATRNHPAYPATFVINENIYTCATINAAISNASIIVLAIPSGAVNEVLAQLHDALTPQQQLVSTTKGLLNNQVLLPSEVIRQFLIRQNLPADNYAVLAGPNIAREIADKTISAAVIATRNKKLYASVSQAFTTRYFRIYSNPDVFGVELAGVSKNIYAIAAGLADARGMGLNTKAMLITRSIAEMGRFSHHLGANPMTMMGLAGIGDLTVTCTSPHSRNYSFGYALGSGVDSIAAQDNANGVVEGVKTVKIIYDHANESAIDMPILSSLHDILYKQTNLVRTFRQLMNKLGGTDVDFSLS